MKNLLFILIFVILASCSETNKKAKVAFRFPAQEDLGQTKSFYKHNLDTLMNSAWSGQITQASQIDCWGLLIGGAEENNKRNFCNELSTDNRLVNFGDYFAALPGGDNTIEIELDADVEREITLIGMGSQDGNCIDFSNLSPPSSYYTHPRILHQQTYTFSPGEQTVVIDVNSIFDSTNSEIDFCQLDSTEEPEAVTPSTPALLTFSSTATYDYGSIAIGTPQSHIFSLANSGGTSATNLTATALSAAFGFTGGTFPGTSGNCTTTLPAGASCTLDIEFNPSSAAAFNDSLTINYNDGSANTSVTRSLQGTGVAQAVLSISHSPTYFYGSTPVGTVLSFVFTVTNGGTLTATALSETGLAAPFQFTGGSYPGTAGTCGATLAPASATCNLDIEYAPVAVNALDTETITLSYNNGSGTVQATRDIQGTALAPALLTLSDGPTFDYGSNPVGGINSHTFTVTNTGGFQASAMTETGIAAPFNFAGGSYPGTGGTCTTTLSAGANCTLVIDYSPTAVSADADTIDIAYNDGAAVQNSTRAIQGVGVTPASLFITESDPFDYGSHTAGGTSSHTFTLSNAGGFQATALSDVGLALPFQFLGGSFPGTGGTCTTTLSAAATCDIVVEFAPTATGVFSDTIDMSYNNGVAIVNSTRDVTGTGIAPALLDIAGLDPYDYGSVGTGTPVTYTFTITNSGGSTATGVSDGAGLATPFSYTGGFYPGTAGTCSASLAAGNNCDIDITYNPAAVTSYSDTIIINYNDGAAAQVLNHGVQGTGM